MRVLAFLFTLLGLSAASQLISPGEIGNLFSGFLSKKLTEDNNHTFKNALEIIHRPKDASARSHNTYNQPRQSFICLACRSAVGAFFQNVRSDRSQEEITETLVHLCTSIGIMSYTVCHGAVVLNMPILTYIIRNEPASTPDAFCGLVLQVADDPHYCPINDDRFEWQVQLPEKPAVTAEPVKNDKPLKVAIITDAHIDPLYEAFGVAECDAPTCCRIGQTPRTFSYRSYTDNSLFEKAIVNDNGESKLNLSVASEIGRLRRESKSIYQNRNPPAPAGYWGDYRNCDTPVWAFDDAIERIHENHEDIDVIYYMGDTIDHGIWETSYELINDVNKYLIQKIRNTFGDHVLVVPTIGNHESQPTNQFAPSRITGEKLNTTWLYKGLADKWDFYLTEDAKETLLEQGDFSIQVRPGLRVISLNSNIAYKYNWWLVYDPLDAKKHLEWLIEELYKAELAGDKVHILTHISPGTPDLTHTWTREYNKIVNRFTETIAAEFNGHTHSDEFRIFYSPDGTPINVAWGAGSITAYTFYNLNYKIATFDNSFGPDSIMNYAYNLTDANLTPSRRPHWFLLNDMKTSYGLTDLSPQSMNNLVYSMVSDNNILLQLYTAFYSKISDVRWPSCNDECKIVNLCKTVVTVLWDRQRCDELRQLFTSNRRL